jgi:hypothetical protein
MKFCGKYSGKYKKTVATSTVSPFTTPTAVTSSKGTAEVTISEVGCGAYLINIIKDGDSSNPINELAYLEDNILRASSSSGKGITSIYFEDNRLIVQLSGRRTSTEWDVINYSLKKCKC